MEDKKRFEEMKKLIADETDKVVYENLKKNQDKKLI